MNEIQITLPDGSVRLYERGVTALEVAKSISEGLARNVLSAKIRLVSWDEIYTEVWDATRSIPENAYLTLLTWNDKEGKQTMWHSSAHILAEALEALYPGIKFGIGPPIDNGFYYDVDFGHQSFTSEDLKKVEEKMNELVKQNSLFLRKEVTKSDAITFFTQKGDEYK